MFSFSSHCFAYLHFLTSLQRLCVAFEIRPFYKSYFQRGKKKMRGLSLGHDRAAGCAGRVPSGGHPLFMEPLLLCHDPVTSHLALPVALFPGSREPCLLLAQCKLQNSQQHRSDRPELAFPPVTRKLAPWCLAWPSGRGLRRPPVGRIQGGRESLNLQNSEPAGHRQPLWNARS